MWSDILSLFKGSGLNEEAFEESLLMLDESHSMFKDCVTALHTEGSLVTDIYERDRQINKYERSVRRKIVTHMSVSSKPDINLGLVLTAIVIDVERIGDYTKNIAELAATLEEPFDALDLNEDVEKMESSLDGMFEKVATALRESDEAAAREVMEIHGRLSDLVETDILRLRRREVLKGRSGHAVTVAIYLRFLKRVSAHLKNVATSVVNPYHRIGFREKEGPINE